MVALIVDRARARRRAWRRGRRLVGISGALGVGVVALAPLAVNFVPDLPFTMEAVVLPRWYTTVAPRPPPGRVLLSVPGPVLGGPGGPGLAGGQPYGLQPGRRGGPRGDERPAGRAGPGFDVLNVLSLGFSMTEPSPTRGQPGRRAPCPAHLGGEHRGDRPGAVGPGRPAGARSRLCRRLHDRGAGAAARVIQAGAWVWDDVHAGPAGHRGRSRHRLHSCRAACAATRRQRSAGVVTASMGVPTLRCRPPLAAQAPCVVNPQGNVGAMDVVD